MMRCIRPGSSCAFDVGGNVGGRAGGTWTQSRRHVDNAAYVSSDFQKQIALFERIHFLSPIANVKAAAF
jgi:hypothetical protein